MEGDPPPPPAPPSVDAGPAINAPLVTAILIELRGSEAKFVDDLQQTIERFIHPMEAGGILSPSDVDALFSNMKSLILTHRAMLDALPAVSLDGEAVALSVLAEQAATTARSFVALAPFLQMHAVYAANYEDHAHDALSRLQKQSAFAKFCAAAEVSGASLPDGALPLQALLIKPIQRLCKYPLFFDRLHAAWIPDEGCSPADAATAAGVLGVLAEGDATVRQLAERVNTSLAKARQQERLVEVLERLRCLPLLEPHRQLLLEARARFVELPAPSGSSAPLPCAATSASPRALPVTPSLPAVDSGALLVLERTASSFAEGKLLLLSDALLLVRRQRQRAWQPGVSIARFAGRSNSSVATGLPFALPASSGSSPEDTPPEPTYGIYEVSPVGPRSKLDLRALLSLTTLRATALILASGADAATDDESSHSAMAALRGVALEVCGRVGFAPEHCLLVCGRASAGARMSLPGGARDAAMAMADAESSARGTGGGIAPLGSSNVQRWFLLEIGGDSSYVGAPTAGQVNATLRSACTACIAVSQQRRDQKKDRASAQVSEEEHEPAHRAQLRRPRQALLRARLAKSIGSSARSSSSDAARQGDRSSSSSPSARRSLQDAAFVDGDEDIGAGPITRRGSSASRIASVLFGSVRKLVGRSRSCEGALAGSAAADDKASSSQLIQARRDAAAALVSVDDDDAHLVGAEAEALEKMQRSRSARADPATGTSLFVSYAHFPRHAPPFSSYAFTGGGDAAGSRAADGAGDGLNPVSMISVSHPFVSTDPAAASEDPDARAAAHAASPNRTLSARLPRTAQIGSSLARTLSLRRRTGSGASATAIQTLEEVIHGALEALVHQETRLVAEESIIASPGPESERLALGARACRTLERVPVAWSPAELSAHLPPPPSFERDTSESGTDAMLTPSLAKTRSVGFSETPVLPAPKPARPLSAASRTMSIVRRSAKGPGAAAPSASPRSPGRPLNAASRTMSIARPSAGRFGRSRLASSPTGTRAEAQVSGIPGRPDESSIISTPTLTNLPASLRGTSSASGIGETGQQPPRPLSPVLTQPVFTPACEDAAGAESPTPLSSGWGIVPTPLPHRIGALEPPLSMGWGVVLSPDSTSSPPAAAQPPINAQLVPGTPGRGQAMQVAAPPPGLSAKALKVLGVSAEEIGGAVSAKALKVLGASAEEMLDRATAQPHKLAVKSCSAPSACKAAHLPVASSSATSMSPRSPSFVAPPPSGAVPASSSALLAVVTAPRGSPLPAAPGFVSEGIPNAELRLLSALSHSESDGPGAGCMDAPSTETYRITASSSAPSLATRVPRLTITPGDGTAGAEVFVEATRRLRSVSSFPRRPPAAPVATDAEARVALPKLRSIASSPRPTPTTPTVAQLDVVLSKWSPSAGKSAAQMGAVGAQAELSGTELLRLARKSLKPSLLKVHESPIEDASLSI